MFLINLAMNSLIFFVILNVGKWFSNRKRPDAQPVSYSFLPPLVLGMALTLADSLRIAFIWQLVLFIIIAILIYWLFYVFMKK
ncbi:MAG: hypothetical protein GXY50_00760 [Syntrophomonadaceae bacterium]|nr:hypothetical protein [Syntrophomonadaceae bacterium]